MINTIVFSKFIPFLILSPLISVFILLLPLKSGMDITVACCFISFLTTIIFYRQHIEWNRYKTIFVCYILFGVYLEIWGVNTYKSGELRTLIYAALFILTVPTRIISKNFLKILVVLSTIFLFFQAIYSHHFLDIARVEGYTTNPVQYATICATLSIFLYVFIINETYRKYQAGLTIVFIASLLTLIYTGSRGPWIAFLGAFLLISFLGFRLIRKNLGWSAFITAGLCACILIPAGYKTFEARSNHVQNEYILYQQQNHYESSVGARLHLYKNALYTITRDKFMGMKVPYDKNLEELSDLGIYKAKKKFGHFHNSYLDRLAKFGLPGLLLLFAFVLYPSFSTLKNYSINDSFFLMALTPACVYLLAALTAVTFRSEESLLFFVIINYLSFLVKPDLSENQPIRTATIERREQLSFS